MKKEYQRNLLKEAFSVNGLGDMYGEKIPVMIKRNFIPDEYAELEAGTLCYIDSSKECCSQVEKDNAYFTLTLYFPTNVCEEHLRCVVEKETKKIIVFGLKENISLSDFICSPDEGISTKIKEYAVLDEKYENNKFGYDDIRENIVWSGIAFAVIMFVVGSFLWAMYSLMPAGIALLVLGAVSVFLAIYFLVKEYESTKKGKALANRIDDLSLEIMNRDAELVNQFATCEKMLDKKLDEITKSGKGLL